MSYDNPRHDYKVTGHWGPKASGKKTTQHAYKKGGSVHSDEAADERLIRKEVKKSALKHH